MTHEQHALLTTRSRRVKDARRLLRRRERVAQALFLADGPKAVEGALGVDGCVRELFATPAAARVYAALLGGADVTLVDEPAIKALSDSVTPAGVVAVCRPLDRPAADVLAAVPGEKPRETTGAAGDATASRTVVICADVRDPGNAGTIIRTADAVGAAGVVLAGDSVDVYNPKAVRSSVGSLFHVPIAVEPDPAAAVAAARTAGFRVLAADAGGEVDLFTAGDLLGGRVAWLFGNEAWGLPEDLAALADHRVAIPIVGRAESLNLAMAAAVCLYAGLQAASAPRS